MITDLQSAELMVLLYNQRDSPDDLSKAFDYYDPGNGPHGVHVAWKVIDGETVIWLPGSYNFWDWVKDSLAFVLPWDHDVLGPVHPGFEMGMERLAQTILINTNSPRKLRGHSLGAGRGAITAGLLKEAGVPPVDCVWWGQPKPGMKQLADYIAGITTRNYCNTDGGMRVDRVTEAPITIPPWEQYRHTHPIIHVVSPPDPEHTTLLGIFDLHHMDLYAKAMVEL